MSYDCRTNVKKIWAAPRLAMTVLNMFKTIVAFPDLYMRSAAIIHGSSRIMATPFVHSFRVILVTNCTDGRTECNCSCADENQEVRARHTGSALTIHLIWLTTRQSISIRVAYGSTQPCIALGSLNQVPALAGVKAGMSPLCELHHLQHSDVC